MAKNSIFTCVVAGLLLSIPLQSVALTNPDQISIFFPAMEGNDNLGRNVSTVLSLQLAQTTRRMPWPDNPQQHDFGEGIIRYTITPLKELNHEAANAIAQNRNLRAQMVIWGRTFQYGADIVAEVNVTIPRYRAAPSRNCKPADPIKCDYRQKNFESWQVSRDDRQFSVDIPRRKFGISAIVLRQNVVDRFKIAKGLVVRKSIENGNEIGVTGSDIRFLEFNKRLPGAPTRVRSNGVEGYVSLPELSEQVSEYADFVGGILQVFRGDWELAVRSFDKVLKNPKTRTMIRVDSLLYSGMVKMRLGIDGREDFEQAAELAPFDHMVSRYQINGAIASMEKKATVKQMLDAKSFLFAADDPWFLQVQDWADNL